MERHRTTLSFLTESKTSAAEFSSMRRVAMTLLVMFLMTATGTWAQEGSDVTTTVESEDTEESISLIYTITNEDQRQAKVSGYKYEGEKLQTLNIPTTAIINGNSYSITSIGDDAFKDCSSLKSVTIPNSVTSIGYRAFAYCENLASVIIPNSVTSIGNRAFAYCEKLASVTISINVMSIGDDTFRECKNLASITIPNSVTSIGSHAFDNCISLGSVIIGNSVTSIGSYAFNDCESLESITIPESVTSIGSHAFDNCINLKSVIIGNGVTSIGSYAFTGCDVLGSVTIGNSVTSIGSYAFNGCINLDPLIIPNSVTSIGEHAFYECTCFDSVEIPNSVTSIGPSAFSGCSSLKSVEVGNSVTNIGDNAFANCEELESITLNSNPKIGTNVFNNTPATVTMNLTASDINGDKWTTFYNNGYKFQADDNTTVYKGTVDGSFLVLTEVEDKIVDSGTAVILKSTDNPIVMTLTDSESSDTNDNDLRGISDRTLRTDVIANISDADAIYTMGNTQAGFGFHRYTGNYVPAGKAFLPLNTNNGAKAQSLTMVFANLTTEVSELQDTNYSQSSSSNASSPIYDLNGRKVSENNLKPGIYVKNGKKFVVK